MATYLVTSGQTLSGVTLGSSDAEYVLPGGTASSTIINGGFQDDAGTAVGTVINGGYQFVEAGGSASNTTINGGGGGQLIMSGGIATSTTINSGGEQDDYGTASGTVINTGGVEIVEGNGVATGAIINGGVQYLYGGGSASNTTLNSGLQFVEFGGAASNTAVNGGDQLVMSGATATGATINGGYQDDFGTASGTTINKTGIEFVEAGGLATGAIVNGGEQYVYAGGVARNTTINSGIEYVAAGGTANGVTFGGTTGVLQLDQPASLTGTISGWRIGDAIAFLHGTVTSAAISGSTLRVTMSGGQNFNYQLAGQQAGTVVQLSSGNELRLAPKLPPAVREALAHDTGTSSTDGITFDPALTGSGDPNATVHFTIDGTPIAATVIADAAGNWSYTPTGLVDGLHTVVASETDAAGQTGSASLSFRLDADKNVAPSLLVAGGGTPTINAGVSHSVVFVVTGLDDEIGTATFSDGKSNIAVTVLGNANYTVDLSALADGPISSTLTVGDIAGNNFVTTGNQITLDTDKGVAPVLLVNGGQPVIGIAHAGAVAFTVSGLDDEIGTAMFSDGSHSVTVTVGGNGAYTTNLNGLNPATITSTLNVGDAAGNRFAATGNPLTIDPGPSAGTGATTVGHGKTVDLTALANGLITPGIAGDSESITAVSAAHGTTALSNGTVTYTAPANGSDTLSFTVADQYGDTAAGTVNLTVDPGPSAGTGATTVGHGKPVDLTALANGLILPGLAGDSESITAVGAAYGTASVSNGVVTYTGPSNGSDAITYTVADQYGDTASGMVNVTVDPGPTAGAASIMVAAGASTDLTTYLLGLDKPGIAGDTLSLSGVGTSATKGMVTLSNGQLAYTAPATSGSDAFSYSVADQYGDTASASVTISAVTIGNIGNASGTVVLGNNSTSMGFGQGTVTVVAGNGNNAIAGGTANDTVVAGNGNNTVILGQGNNTVILGSGNDSVTVGDGNNTITIAGSAASTDAIKAGGGNNTLYLGAGHETVSLGGGNNTLILTTGTYDVSAGHGTDLFEFTGPQALLNLSFASNDELVFRATGFDLGIDSGLGTATPQPIAASLFSSHTDGTFATSDNRFAYNSSTGTLYYDAHGSSPGSTSFAVADLTNHPHLGASNLFFTS